MIPASFDYVRADTIDAAVAALAEYGDDAKLLAGGHSLLPLMKLRFATPAVLVDIGRLSELGYVRDGGAYLAIGALTTHSVVESDGLVRANAGLLADATHHVGDPQVRHRGTIGGAVAHGDPAGDIASALLALGATVVVTGPDGERTIAIDDFFTGFLETDLGETEVLTEIRVPKAPDARWSFQKFNRRAQDWAIVGASVLVDGPRVGVGLVNMGATPLRAATVESALRDGATAATAAEHAADGCDPPADLHADSSYRAHLARVLVRRGLEAAGR